jgi:hypothetical protein
LRYPAYRIFPWSRKRILGGLPIWQAGDGVLRQFVAVVVSTLFEEAAKEEIVLEGIHVVAEGGEAFVASLVRARVEGDILETVMDEEL